MTDVSNDADFAWGVAKVPAPSRVDFASSTVVIVAWRADCTPEPLGNATLVYARSDVAIAITARHVLDHVLEYSSPKRQGHPSAGIWGPDKKFYLFDKKHISAICNVDGIIKIYEVGQVISSQNMESSLIALHYDATDSVKFSERTIALNFSIPNVGDLIWSFGYELKPVIDISTHIEEKKFQTELRFNIKRGFVKEVCLSGVGIIPGPCFRTTIPFSGGESGLMVVDH